MASELRVNTLKDASGNNSIATSFVAGGSAKAWLNLDGSATFDVSDTEINDSFNVGSTVDNGTGDYTVTFSNALSNANYSSTMSCGQDSTGNSGLRAANGLSSTARTTSVIRVGTATASSTANRTSIDDDTISLAIHGDLA